MSLSIPLPAPPPHLEEGIQMEGRLGYNLDLQCLQDFNQAKACLESKQSKEAQKLEHKYNTQQMKMDRRHEQEWLRMAPEGNYTFQEIFLMTSLSNSVKLLPWCISSAVPLGYMDDMLVPAMQKDETAPATLGMPEPEEPPAPGLSSSPAHPTEIPPAIPLLLDLPFEGTPSMGCSFFKSLASPSQKKRDCSPSRSFSNHHGKRTQVDSPEVEVRSEHSSTWGGNYMLKVILDTRPSSAQQRQGSSSVPFSPTRANPNDGMAAGSLKSTTDWTSSNSGSSM